MKEKIFFSDLGDDYGDRDDYDMKMDDGIYNEYSDDDDDDLDLDDDLYEYEDDSLYAEDHYSESDDDDDDDVYHETKRDMWRNMDWDKD